MSRSLIITFILCALAVPTFAQTTGVPGTNDLVINGNGSGGTSSVFNASLAGPVLDFDVSAAPGDLVIGVWSPAAAPGSIPLTSGTFVDVSLMGLVSFVDGFSPTVGPFPVDNTVPASGLWEMTLPFTLPMGGTMDIQFGLVGPGFVGGIGTTQAHTLTAPPVLTTTYTLGDDNFQAHTLAPTNAITFYGVTYSTIYLGSNGQITFNAGSGDFSVTMPEFFAGWQTSPTTAPNPGIALLWTDLNNPLPGGGFTDVVEDTTTGVTNIQYMNQNWWSSGEPAGNFSANFLAPGVFQLDYTMLIPSTAVTSTNPTIIGVSNGDDVSPGLQTDLSNALGTGWSTAIPYMTPMGGAPESVGEVIPPNTAINTIIGGLTFSDMSGTGNWTVL